MLSENAERLFTEGLIPMMPSDYTPKENEQIIGGFKSIYESAYNTTDGKKATLLLKTFILKLMIDEQPPEIIKLTESIFGLGFKIKRLEETDTEENVTNYVNELIKNNSVNKSNNDGVRNVIRKCRKIIQ